LTSETYSLAYMTAVFGLFVPYPVLKTCLVVVGAIGLWFLVAVPARRRIKARRFEGDLKRLLRQPL